MRDIADHWYNSGTFLGVAGIAAAAVFGALGVWAAFRAANPRQELAWQVRARIPLLNDQVGSARDTVQVQLDGKPLACPTVLEIRLVNRGRRDIPTTAFDQGRALRVEVGAPIVRHLSTVSDPQRFRAPRIAIEGSAFTLGPDLLKKGQSVTVSLLLDGNASQVTVPEPPFIDINVRERAGGSESIAAQVAGAASAAAVMAALAAGVGEVAGVTLVAVVAGVATATAIRRLLRGRD